MSQFEVKHDKIIQPVVSFPTNEDSQKFANSGENAILDVKDKKNDSTLEAMADKNTQKGQDEEKCVGCTNVWTDKDSLVAHWINKIKTSFCINCYEWVKDKTKVLEPDWSLFDKWGNL